jgi:arylsulfatase A-like enzyme
MEPSRRSFLRGAGTLAAMAGTPAPGAPSPSRPNLLYVFGDQLGYHRCGYAGDEYARTPNIDRLASEGCNFRQAVSNSPVCAPYRASMLTGKYQSSTGMVINELRLSPEHECFGHVLRRGGYRTAYVGKWHLWANELGNHPLTRNGFVPPGPYRLGFDDVWAAYNFSHDYYGGPYFRNTPDRETWKDYEPDAQTGFTIDFMRDCSARSEPFAAFLSWGPPHEPWSWKNVAPRFAGLYRRAELPLRPNYSSTPDPYADDWAKLPPDYPALVKEKMRVYYAQAASIDWNLGRLMKALDELGIADNTILVFTSDHGEMFGSHGRQAKYIFYEEAARVPFLVRWPAKIPEKTVSEALLGAPDIMPTLLRMMNLDAPRSVEGTDLGPHALGAGGSSATTASPTRSTSATARSCCSTTSGIPTNCGTWRRRRAKARNCATTGNWRRNGGRSTTTRSSRAPGTAITGPATGISLRRRRASGRILQSWTGSSGGTTSRESRRRSVNGKS